MAENTKARPINVRVENLAGRDAHGRFIHVGDIRQRNILRAKLRSNQGDRLPAWSDTVLTRITPMAELKADGSNLNSWMEQLQYRFFLLDIDPLIDTRLSRPLPSSSMRDTWEKWSRWARYWIGSMVSEEAKVLMKTTMAGAEEPEFADDFLEDIRRCIKTDDPLETIEGYIETDDPWEMIARYINGDHDVVIDNVTELSVLRDAYTQTIQTDPVFNHPAVNKPYN
ncbi:unnamed protein product [Penicillium bialowiezense]